MLLSGILYDAGGPLASVKIVFEATKTTLNGVLIGADRSFTTQEDGTYSIDLQPGYYTVWWIERGNKVPLGRIVADVDSEMSLPEALEADYTPLTPSYIQDAMDQMQADLDAAVALYGDLDAVDQARISSETAADRAETARDAAQLSAGVHADTTAGLAATASGEYFSVPSAEDDDEYVRLYRNDAGTAISRDNWVYPSIHRIDGLLASSRDLFRRSETHLFPDANLSVRRYTSGDAVTDYDPGYAQTASANGLSVAVPEVGEGYITHYLNTGISGRDETIVAEFTINSVDSVGCGVGVGWVGESGLYVQYHYSVSGNFKRNDGYTETTIVGGGSLATYGVGDVVRFEVDAGQVSVFINGTLSYTHDHAEGEFASDLLFAQRGWLTYTASLSVSSDPVRDYVTGLTDPLAADIDALRTGSVVQSDLDAQAASLFSTSASQTFPDADLTVRRYKSNTDTTDYDPGYAQTSTPDGLLVEVPAVGSTGIKHYLHTREALIAGQKFTAQFEISTIDTQYDGVGVGYISDAGDYITYALTSNGVVRKFVNYDVSNLSGTVATYVAGDTVAYAIENGVLSVSVNGSTVHAESLTDGEFAGDVLIGQRGFLTYVAEFQSKADPIRNYVKEHASQTLPEGFYAFTPNGAPGGLEQFTVYARLSGNVYVGFNLIHEKDMSELVYLDYWRLLDGYFYTYDGAEMTGTGKRALLDGENETVFKRNASKDDFTGGYHGDELVESVRFFASGVEIDPASLSAAIPLTPCSEFSYLEHSTMHETAEGGVVVTGHPIECRHIKRTTVKDAGYETFNRLTWEQGGDVAIWYSALVCVHKDTATEGYTDAAFAPITFDGTKGNSLTDSTGSREMVAWNGANELSAHVTSEVLKPAVEDAGSEFFVNDRLSDSKYYRRLNYVSAAVGDVWESVARVRFAAR